MLGWVKSLLGIKDARPSAVRVSLAKYDSAQTTADNRKHWANADSLSADAANSAEVRKILRMRARYETQNNSYAKGMVLTLANDLIGTGPRLQIQTDNPETDRSIEAAWAAWAEEIGLAEKLRSMRMARATDGEAFLLLFTNPRLVGPIKLDIRPIEADQVASASMSMDPKEVDGILFDDYGNPVSYSVLRYHPGSGSGSVEFDRYSADQVLHYFRPERPGQHRGIPDITPALPLFSQLRRYTLAVVAAAETAADFAMVIYSDGSAGSEDAPSPEAMDEIELTPRMATVLPQNWKLGQAQPTQPTNTYAEFKHEILNEIARCLNMPYNIAACNSSSYNYASGRLDHQTYYRDLAVEQARIESQILNRIFATWIQLASAVVGGAGFDSENGESQLVRSWFWGGREHVDPTKEASAQTQYLANNTTTLAREYAKQGLDWEAQLQQRAKEKQLIKELGLETAPAPSGESMPENDEESDEEEESDEGAA